MRDSAVRTALLLVVVVAVLVRLHTRSALWLDEALTVNIASVPLTGLADALRQDGAPPLYYALLKGWTELFGAGNVAVRALSTVWALAALPLAYLAGSRLGDRTTGVCALVLVGVNPFAVSFATETRMYAMVSTLVLAGVLALHAALRRPDLPRLAGVAILAAALALTHYWALFLLAVVGAGLLAAAVRGPVRPAARRCAVALAAGGLLFLPWLPTFLFQNAHTGTPWADPPSYAAALQTVFAWAGGGTGPALLLGVVTLGLIGVALVGRTADVQGRTVLTLGPPVRSLAALLTAVAVLTMLLGLTLTRVSSSGYAVRYSSVVLPVALLVAALGLRALPRRARLVVGALVVGCGLGGSLSAPFDSRRTQAPITAGALSARLQPGDLVVYCPDQLGPAMHRLLPPGTPQIVYPTQAGPERIDWVDYAERNGAADPEAFATQVARRTRGAVWLVYAEGYKTFRFQCQTLDQTLEALRGDREQVLRPQGGYGEIHTLVRYSAAGPSA